MPNNRIHYACQRVGIAPLGSTSYTTVRGLQSVGMTTTFNLTQAFELGQIAVYENIEGIPDIECTFNKVLDGYAPVYTLVTQTAAGLGGSATLIGRSTAQCSAAVGIYSDTANSSDGTAISTVTLSGLYVSSVGYTMNINDNAVENVTCVGNNRIWIASASMTWLDSPFAANDDSPRALSGSGGVNRREDFLFGANGSLLPKQIPGISSDYTNVLSGTSYSAHVQSVAATVNLGREDLFELGRKGNYNKYVRFPVQVTCAIGITSVSGDLVSASEEGLYSEGGSCGKYNLTNERILIKMCEGLRIDLGSLNKLSSVNITGGDAGGGNQEITYNYTNFNDFTVYHPQDPNWGTTGFTATGSAV